MSLPESPPINLSFMRWSIKFNRRPVYVLVAAPFVYVVAHWPILPKLLLYNFYSDLLECYHNNIM